MGVRVCVCVCVCARERETDRQTMTEGDREAQRDMDDIISGRTCVRVFCLGKQSPQKMNDWEE